MLNILENTFCFLKINVEIKFNYTKTLRQTESITEGYVACSTKLLDGPLKGKYSDIHMLYVDYVDLASLYYTMPIG